MRMDLLSASPKPDNSEKRIFECPKCHFIETKMIPDPLISNDIRRLTSRLQPPS
jgi:hypothetical protein